MSVITMLTWCPLMLEVLGVRTDRRYFTILHTRSGIQYFDGIQSADLLYPAALTEFKTHDKNKRILESFTWEGESIQTLPHILVFDQLLERVGVADYKSTTQLLTLENQGETGKDYHHDVIASEEQAVEILSNWLASGHDARTCRRVC